MVPGDMWEGTLVTTTCILQGGAPGARAPLSRKINELFISPFGYIVALCQQGGTGKYLWSSIHLTISP